MAANGSYYRGTSGFSSAIVGTLLRASSKPGRASGEGPNGNDMNATETSATEARGTCVTAMMRRAGLRPTRQRLALASLLFGRGNRHISAESLYEEAILAKVPVSLATIYNTLHQFTEAGLLRELAVDGSKSYFDTNVGDHHHFFIEGDNAMLDIPADAVGIDKLPIVPEGMEVVRVDVVVRLRRKA